MTKTENSLAVQDEEQLDERLRVLEPCRVRAAMDGVRPVLTFESAPLNPRFIDSAFGLGSSPLDEDFASRKQGFVQKMPELTLSDFEQGGRLAGMSIWDICSVNDHITAIRHGLALNSIARIEADKYRIIFFLEHYQSGGQVMSISFDAATGVYHADETSLTTVFLAHLNDFSHLPNGFSRYTHAWVLSTMVEKWVEYMWMHAMFETMVVQQGAGSEAGEPVQVNLLNLHFFAHYVARLLFEAQLPDGSRTIWSAKVDARRSVLMPEGAFAQAFDGWADTVESGAEAVHLSPQHLACRAIDTYVGRMFGRRLLKVFG